MANSLELPVRLLSTIIRFSRSAFLWASSGLLLLSVLLWLTSYFWVVQINWAGRPLGVLRVFSATGMIEIRRDTSAFHGPGEKPKPVYPDQSGWSVSVF